MSESQLFASHCAGFVTASAIGRPLPRPRPRLHLGGGYRHQSHEPAPTVVRTAARKSRASADTRPRPASHLRDAAARSQRQPDVCPGTPGPRHRGDHARHLFPRDPRDGQPYRACDVRRILIEPPQLSSRTTERYSGLSAIHHVLPANLHFLRVKPRGFEPLTSAVQRRLRDFLGVLILLFQLSPCLPMFAPVTVKYLSESYRIIEAPDHSESPSPAWLV